MDFDQFVTDSAKKISNLSGRNAATTSVHREFRPLVSSFVMSLVAMLMTAGVSRAGITLLDDPAAPKYTSATGISGPTIVGYYVDGTSVNNGFGNVHGFIYNGASYTNISNPSAPTNGPTYLTGVSGNTVVGYYADPTYLTTDTNFANERGFTYGITSQTYAPVNDPNAASPGGTFPIGIYGNTIYGEYLGSTGGFHGFVDAGGVFTTLDEPLAVTDTQTEGTTVAGQSGNTIVGSYSTADGDQHGYTYNTITKAFTSFDAPLATADTDFNGISGNNIVGTYSNNSSGYAFVYNIITNTYTTVNVPGYANGDGIDGNNVVGTYIDSSGNEHGFETTVPEPDSLIGIGVGTIGMVARRRRVGRSADR